MNIGPAGYASGSADANGPALAFPGGVVQLSPDEIDALLRLLDVHLPELRVEVHRAEFSREFRSALEHDEALLTTLRARLLDERERQQRETRH